MNASSPLLLDLAGIARLANVQRPVASVWRSRFATAYDPFPPAVTERGGRALFDSLAVAEWLARTQHGNNPDVVADAAASASPAGFDVSETSHVAIVDALLALRSVSGGPVGGLARDELRRRAALADPQDSCLATEISESPEHWAEWADLLADAAYSPIGASRLLERRHAATQSSAGSSGPLSTAVDHLVIALAEALTMTDQAELVVNAEISPSLVAQLVSRVGEDIDLVVPEHPQVRRIRRRSLCDGLGLPAAESVADAPRLFIERLPSGGAKPTSEILHAVDELVLGMRDHDRAIVLAPASALVDTLAKPDGLVRTDVLRSGRVRAIAKLPSGLLVASPRESLALWVLGRESVGVSPADRFTAIADLTGRTITEGTRADLTSDVLAAVGDSRAVRAHAFRFTRLIRTTSLLASQSSLVAGAGTRGNTSISNQELPAIIDMAFVDLGADAPQLSPEAAPGPTLSAASVEQLIADRHLRLRAGTRLAPDELAAAGIVVVGQADLDDPSRIGERHVDPLEFAERHPSARLTDPGDVIFRTAPSAKAWVDHDGSKIVVYPARILRIDKKDPGGLLAELIVADIENSLGGPGSWRRWLLRRVPPLVTEPLRRALGDLATRREALKNRITALDSYAELLSLGVVSGAVTLTDHAATAASDD